MTKKIILACAYLAFITVSLLPSSSYASCNIVGGQAYGNCSGVTINRGKAKFEEVTSSRTVGGISEGAMVMRSGYLSISGISDRVIVEEGGRAAVSGQVGVLRVAGSASVSGMVRSVVLDGGDIEIIGIVGSLSGQGSARLAAGSVVGGVPTPEARNVTYE